MLVARPGDSEGDTQSLRVVITDFGLARAIETSEGADRRSLSKESGVFGTPDYMAPEQVTGGEVTHGADIYALGVVLYELVTGRLPFSGDTPLARATRRLDESPPTPERLAPGLESRWSKVILRCLAREPRDRFSSALHVAQVLGNSSKQRQLLTSTFLVLIAIATLAAARLLPHHFISRNSDRSEAALGLPDQSPESDSNHEPRPLRQINLRPFEVPGSTSTVPWGLNDRGNVVGFYLDSSGNRHGFKFMGGQFRDVVIPGLEPVTPRGINARGDIVGYTQDPTGAAHGFLVGSDGSVTRINAPGAAETGPRCINDQRTVVGVTIDHRGVVHGLRYQDGTFSAFDVPGYATDDWGQPCINDQGMVTSSLVDADDRTVRAAITASRATVLMNLTSKSVSTYAEWISRTGAVVGHITVSASPPEEHGFILMNSDLTIVDYPGALATQVHAINASGKIVGEFRGKDGVRHGFIGTPSD